MQTSISLQPSVLTRSQRSYLNRAMKLAELSQVVQRHGAVLVKGGSVIAAGVNSYTNDPSMFPVSYLNNAKVPHASRGKLLSVHAEIAAIRRASPAQLKGAVLYVARVTKDGSVGLSAPCAHCASVLIKAGIKKVIFTE